MGDMVFSFLKMELELGSLCLKKRNLKVKNMNKIKIRRGSRQIMNKFLISIVCFFFFFVVLLSYSFLKELSLVNDKVFNVLLLVLVLIFYFGLFQYVLQKILANKRVINSIDTSKISFRIFINSVRNFLIKSLGGYTKEEHDESNLRINIAEQEFSQKLLCKEKEIEQLNKIFLAFTDALENYTKDTDNKFSIFSLKVRAFMNNLRLYSMYVKNTKYEVIEENLFDELNSFLSRNLSIIFCEHQFSDEMYEEARSITKRINASFKKHPRSRCNNHSMLDIKELEEISKAKR